MPLIEKGGVGGGQSPPTASRPPRSKEKIFREEKRCPNSSATVKTRSPRASSKPKKGV